MRRRGAGGDEGLSRVRPRRIAPLLEQGLPALEASKRIDLGPYGGWTEPARLVFNVARAYRELRGEPFDAPIDAVALFREMYELEQARG